MAGGGGFTNETLQSAHALPYLLFPQDCHLPLLLGAFPTTTAPELPLHLSIITIAFSYHTPAMCSPFYTPLGGGYPGVLLPGTYS